MYSIGRLCVKLAGRDAGKYCVIVDTIDDVTVLIDGETRRRKCNIRHLEPLAEKIDIKKNASSADITKLLAEKDITVSKTTPKKVAERPKKVRNVKEKVVKEVPVEPKPVKKATPVVENQEKAAEEKEEVPADDNK